MSSKADYYINAYKKRCNEKYTKKMNRSRSIANNRKIKSLAAKIKKLGGKVPACTRTIVIKKSIPVLTAKAKVTRAVYAKATAIKAKQPAIISQEISKAERIPYIIGCVLIAVYLLFKKGIKGGKK